MTSQYPSFTLCHDTAKVRKHEAEEGTSIINVIKLVRSCLLSLLYKQFSPIRTTPPSDIFCCLSSAPNIYCVGKRQGTMKKALW